VIPHDQIVTDVAGGSQSGGTKSNGTDLVYIDLSQAGPGEIDTSQIDTGVTSGADPSEWDPISLDVENRIDSCIGEDGRKRGDMTPPAVCQSVQPDQSSPQPKQP
jgi:hypothetical protein